MGFVWECYKVFALCFDKAMRCIPERHLKGFLFGLHTILIRWYSMFTSEKSVELRSVEWTISLLTGLLPITHNLIVLALDMFNIFWPPKIYFYRRRDINTAGRQSIFLDRPRGVDKAKCNQIIMVYAYGGSFIGGDAESQVNFAHCWQGEQCGVDGVMLPEYGRYPTVLLQPMVEVYGACYEWLLKEGYLPKNIYCGGLSSGGCISFLYFLQQLKKNTGIPLPAGLYGFAPIYDFTQSTKSIEENVDVLITPGVCDVLREFLPKFDPDLPGNSAILMPDEVIKQLPPIVLVATEKEVIIDEIRLMEQRFLRNGVEVESLYIPHVNFHGLTLFAAFEPPEAIRQLEFCKEWLKKQITRNKKRTESSL